MNSPNCTANMRPGQLHAGTLARSWPIQRCILKASPCWNAVALLPLAFEATEAAHAAHFFLKQAGKITFAKLPSVSHTAKAS